MFNCRLAGRTLRIVRDAALALGLFSIVAVLALEDRAQAGINLIPIGTTEPGSAPVLKSEATETGAEVAQINSAHETLSAWRLDGRFSQDGQRIAALSALGLLFAIVLAFTLEFMRHLSRTFALVRNRSPH